MIDTVAVVGSGVMGSEIAQVVASSGRRVWVLDSDPEALERARAHIAGIGERRVAKGRMTDGEATAILERVRYTGAPEDLGTCDLAIEAVPEVLEIKHSVFATLDAALPGEAILASNTSGLSITALAAQVTNPERVVGLHFFNPASVMKLIEVVQGDTTADATVEAALAFATEIGKTPVRVRECPGFLVNRILVRAMASAYATCAESTAARAAADAAVVAQGPAPMGPFALGDLVGLDTLEHIRSDLAVAYDDRYADGGVTAALTAQGRLGAKSGGGFFDGRAPESDPGAPGAHDVALAYYRAAADEAGRCLDEDVAAQDDVDRAMQLGCGWEFGPLRWAAENVDPVQTKGG